MKRRDLLKTGMVASGAVLAGSALAQMGCSADKTKGGGKALSQKDKDVQGQDSDVARRLAALRARPRHIDPVSPLLIRSLDRIPNSVLVYDLNQVEENALSALREMRLMLYRLRPMALESHSLTSVIEDRFNLVERQFSIAAVLQVDYAPELTEKVEEELFYIISEALNNALKHAQATRVKVHFASKDNHLQVTIQDNGKGFDPHQPHKGMGLENIYLRTEKIDGRVELESAIGQGTTIRIIL